MTTANKITIARIVMVPIFLVQILLFLETGNPWNHLLAILAFALAALSDGLDGYIARRYHQKSELGAILDPLADKLLLLSGVLVLSLKTSPHLQPLPTWLMMVIISRDVIVLLGLGVIHYVCKRIIVRPRWTGKLATVLQMVTLLWILLRWPPPYLPGLCLAAALFTALSGLLYLYDGILQLSSSPASAASPKQ